MKSPKNRLSLAAYKEGVLKGDRVILSRAITLIESTLESDQALADELIREILPYTGKSIRIGITGVPGVGKSTFIESFGSLVTSHGHKLAVLAIDPSSQRSGGSIMGDKTRMEILSHDPNAYIRPSAAGASLGGVSAKTREAMLLCEAAGHDVIFIETVGVGQSEIMVRDMVDFFLLLMLAGAGDELQGIKKGIIEIADAIAITKADSGNEAQAKRAKLEYSNALHLFPLAENGWTPQVKICSALENKGLAEIWDMIQSYKIQMIERGHFEKNRKDQRVHWMHEHIKHLLGLHFYQNEKVKALIKSIEEKVAKEEESPIAMAKMLLNTYHQA